MMSSFGPVGSVAAWEALERVPGLATLDILWRRLLGESFASFRSACLVRGNDSAGFLPCAAGCGCLHEVIRHGPADIVAVCRCHPERCAPLPVKEDDLSIWEVSWPLLARGLCRALQLEPRLRELCPGNTRQIGCWSAAAVPVILTVQSSRAGFQQAVAELVARLRKPFILLCPTSRFHDAVTQELLGNIGAGCIDLASAVHSTPDGRWACGRAPGELFAAFAPETREEVERGTAFKAFDLVRSLDLATPLKPPSVLTVFKLYCEDALSAAQVANRCKCSKTAVMRRLTLIRQKLGRDPREFRRFAPQLQEIENELRETRATRINRYAAAENR